MPLVVPGMMTSGAGASANNDNTNEAWMNKLLGKKLTDGASDETVNNHPFFSLYIIFFLFFPPCFVPLFQPPRQQKIVSDFDLSLLKSSRM